MVKMKNVSFTLWKKLNRLFGQPNISTTGSCIYQMRVGAMVIQSLNKHLPSFSCIRVGLAFEIENEMNE